MLLGEHKVTGPGRAVALPSASAMVGEVGTAGLKDRHAVTRQMVSVPARAEAHLAQLDGDGVRLLTVSRHTNKLKPGHLRGNRFRILIRDAQGRSTSEPLAADVGREQAILDRCGQYFAFVGMTGQRMRIGTARKRIVRPARFRKRRQFATIIVAEQLRDFVDRLDPQRAFAGIFAESLIIDSEHWRYLYLLTGALWGLMLASRRYIAVAAPPTAAALAPHARAALSTKGRSVAQPG